MGLLMLAYGIAALQSPDGGWDAWAIWNLRAKFLLLAPELGLLPASTQVHPDYPPLLPLVIAAGWRLVGFTPLVPVLVHGAVYGAVLWLTARSHQPPRLWTVILVGAAALPYAALQYADLAVGLALLAATCACFARREAWAGLALGLSALTKNEGLMLALVFLVVWTSMERRMPWRAWGAALPCLMLLAAYKLSVHAPNDILGAPGMMARLTDFPRYAIIGLFAGWMLVSFAGGALPLLVVAAWVTGIRPAWNMPLVALIIGWLGFLAVYVITPNDLLWHLMSSMDRLLLQLFPALAVALLARQKDK